MIIFLAGLIEKMRTGFRSPPSQVALKAFTCAVQNIFSSGCCDVQPDQDHVPHKESCAPD